MIKNSTNSRFMSKIVRKNAQSNPLRKVGECLYRNGHGVYFAWFSVRGKQLKRSLKTSDKELARRRQAELLLRKFGTVRPQPPQSRFHVKSSSAGCWSNYVMSLKPCGVGQRRSLNSWLIPVCAWAKGEKFGGVT